MLLQKTCIICGAPFSYQHWRKNAKYCSSKCQHEGLRAPNNAVCAACGKPFHLKQSHIDRFIGAQGFFCSKECSKVGSRIRMTGKNNHQYGLKGELNSSFKGKETSNKNHKVTDIYVYSPDHPFRNQSNRVTKHRLVVEENCELFPSEFFVIIDGKKYLRKEFVVHHIDGNHSNNDISNLEVLTRGKHTSIHNKSKYIIRSRKTGRIVATPSLPISDIEFEEAEELDNSDRGE